MNPQDELNKAIFSELLKKSFASDNLWLKGLGVVVSAFVLSYTVVKTGILNRIPMEVLQVFIVSVVILSAIIIHTLYKMSVEKEKKLIELNAKLEELTRLTWDYGVEWDQDNVPHCPQCKKPLGQYQNYPINNRQTAAFFCLYCRGYYVLYDSAGSIKLWEQVKQLRSQGINSTKIALPSKPN